MKRIKYIVSFLFAFLMFVPFVFGAENVVIKSVKLEDKSPAAEELHEATFNGLNVNFDVKFVEVDDYVKYKIVLKNNSKKEYDVELSDLTNEHMEYKYDVGNNVTIKANSELTINTTITYKTAVTPEELQDGAYVENKEFTISLSGEDNPKTGDINIAIIIILLIIVFGFLYYKVDSKQTKLSFVILLGIVLIPLTIYAAEKLTVTINSKVTISEDITFYIKSFNSCESFRRDLKGNANLIPNNDTKTETEDGGCLYKYNAKQGMTFEDFINTYTLNNIFIGGNIYYEYMSTTPITPNDPIVNSHVYYEQIFTQLRINDTDYNIIEGMTLGEWKDSPFNTDHIEFEDGRNMSCDANVTYLIYIPINYALINNTKLKAADIPSLDRYLIYDYKVYNSVNAYTYTVSNETASNCVYKTMIINNKE